MITCSCGWFRKTVDAGPGSMYSAVLNARVHWQLGHQVKVSKSELTRALMAIEHLAKMEQGVPTPWGDGWRDG